ncbi:Pre-mRNA-splicing factor cwc22 [Rhodotorula toruloides ATCC 204091]|uniref:Pre-mRNA-splicing factor cwc22 n=1 Tax=Rhodotorula toruloides TaxID=5286 RepID=A0A2T0AE29_RHOTO|nr:Pre-mRNA-splicing factor cwc22 [Rhodotorula toruloides ATCC 204091]PRQ76257.1 Pre-mRNA-splicing factor cwc22 [Rhodotorula toruloides]
MDMLLSPSRGLLGGDEDESLRNHEVQERFRKHVDEKLQKWSSAHPSTNAQAEARKRRLEELSIILLDFRKLREGVTSSQRKDAFACEAYEASVLLSVYASNDAQLSSSLPPLVSSLHPALLAQRSASSTDTTSDVSDAFARLSVSPTPDAATRAFFLALHLLQSYLLPAVSTPLMPQTPSGTIAAHPPLSFFLPTLFTHLLGLHLPLPTALTPIPQHSDSHIRFLLSFYSALLRNSYTSLARLLSPSHLPPPPPAVTALIASLHLPPTFHPLAMLLSTHTAAIRTNRIWPVVQKAYRFPPDSTAWLSKGLLFEFEVEQEERAAGSAERKERKERISESWEDEDKEQDGQEAKREEAARRADAWVAERKAAR